MAIKGIIFTNEDRKVILSYLQAKADKAKADKAEKDAKAACKELFARLGKAFKGAGKSTAYLYGTVQMQGKPKPVVYKETTAKGAVDWQAYALSLGGTVEGAEQFRKSDTVRTSMDWATPTQEEEIQSL